MAQGHSAFQRGYTATELHGLLYAGTLDSEDLGADSPQQ